MNLRQIFRVLSVLGLILCVFLLLPLLIALCYREYAVWRSFLIPILFLAPAAVLLLLLTRDGGDRELSPRDGFLLVSLSWIVAALLGAMPFILSGAIPRLADAFFESMSGFTTTGASILADVERLPRSILFWRALTHWLGGMGIIVLTVAVFPLLGIGGLQLIRAEAPGPSVDRLTPKIAATAKILWLIYVGLTAAETLLLMFGGMSLFDALTHTFATLATGGFSTRNASVGAFSSAYIDVVVTVFMVLAGANFALHYKLLAGQAREVGRNTELKAYLGIFLAATLVIALFLQGPVFRSFGQSLRYAGFQAASIMTTTGFVTADYTTWPFPAQAVLFIIAFIGGCSGSTAGAIKVVRILILLKLGLIEMKRLIYPRGVFTIRVNRQVVRPGELSSTGGFFFFYLLILLFTTLIVASGGYDLLTSLSSVLVTLGNIGPGFGKVGPIFNYGFLPDYIKWALSLAMMIGRLEVFTVLVLLTPAFWRR
jgi:trk system potassium uptake protein TrkH